MRLEDFLSLDLLLIFLAFYLILEGCLITRSVVFKDSKINSFTEFIAYNYGIVFISGLLSMLVKFILILVNITIGGKVLLIALIVFMVILLLKYLLYNIYTLNGDE